MLYDIGFLIFSLFYLPTLIFKGKLHGDFAERFAIYGEEKRPRLSAGGAIWVQAVSVGEVSLCKRLIPLLKEKFPAHPIVLSTITKAGNDLAKKLFAQDAVIIYFPLDLSFIVKKAVSLIMPKVYIMVETEIWPNMLAELHRRRIPSVLINGRISDRSYGKYMLVKGFLRPALSRVGLFCMQSKADADRIVSMGAPSAKVRLTGNMKFDAVDTAEDNTAEEELFVAGSTHPGEEDAILRVFAELVKEFPDLKLLIAPRHIERAGEVERIVEKAGFDYTRVSRLYQPPTTKYQPPVLILDTIGQLSEFYRRAKLVFIGGSLVRHGGQNPIEPAALGKAVIFGPHMFNFKDSVNILLGKGAVFQVPDEKGLFEKSAFLLRNNDERIGMGRRARAAVAGNRGAVEKNVSAVTQVLNA